MNTTTDASLGMLAALALAAVLAGCAAPPGDRPHGADQAGRTAAAPAVPPSGPFYGQGETLRGGSAAGATGHSDMGEMCAMHRNMEGAPNEEARQAMMERHLGGMSPEQRRQHMEMMGRHCP